MRDLASSAHGKVTWLCKPKTLSPEPCTLTLDPNPENLKPETGICKASLRFGGLDYLAVG